MFSNPLVLEMAQLAVEEAMRLGASFADARFEAHQHEDLMIRNGERVLTGVSSNRGLAVRVLVNGAWGFASVSQPNRHDATVLARRAAEFARAAAILQPAPVLLAHEAAHCAVFRTPIDRDPLAVPIDDKLELLTTVDGIARQRKEICEAITRFAAHRTRKIYLNSEGAEIDQDLVFTTAGLQVTATDGKTAQTRSFPEVGGRTMGMGWEMIDALDLPGHAEAVADDAIELLGADDCPAQTTNIILDAGQMGLQLLHTCGQAAELGRSPGADGGVLAPSALGSFQLGSPLLSVHADPRQVGGPGSFGFDDEGVAAQRVDFVSEGRFCGVLSSRELARSVGLTRSSGGMRSATWQTPPVIRVNNVLLEPGPSGGSLEDLIADTKSGVLMQTGRSWCLDDGRFGFTYGCEQAWEIKDGRKTRRLKNPAYSGRTPEFFGRCDAVCDESEWRLNGRIVDGMGVGCGAAPARFAEVEVGPAGQRGAV